MGVGQCRASNTLRNWGVALLILTRQGKCRKSSCFSFGGAPDGVLEARRPTWAPEIPKKHSVCMNFSRKFTRTSACFPVTWVRNTAETAQKNLFWWTFIIFGGFWVELSSSVRQECRSYAVACRAPMRHWALVVTNLANQISCKRSSEMCIQLEMEVELHEKCGSQMSLERNTAMSSSISACMDRFRQSRWSSVLQITLSWNDCLLLRHGFHNATHLPRHPVSRYIMTTAGMKQFMIKLETAVKTCFSSVNLPASKGSMNSPSSPWMVPMQACRPNDKIFLLGRKPGMEWLTW